MIQNGLVSAILKWLRHGAGVRQFIEVAQKFAGEVSTKLSTNCSDRCSDGVLADYASIRHVPDIFGEFLRGNRTVGSPQRQNRNKRASGIPGSGKSGSSNASWQWGNGGREFTMSAPGTYIVGFR